MGIGTRKRDYFVFPLPTTAQMQSPVWGSHPILHPPPPKCHSSGPSLGTTQHHAWGSRASTSAKMRLRDRHVQLDGDGHSCLHHTGTLDTQDQQNPNSCPDRGGQPHFQSLYPSANIREGSGLPQLRVLLGATEQLQPANAIQVSAVYSLSLSITQVPLNLSLTPTCN